MLDEETQARLRRASEILDQLEHDSAAFVESIEVETYTHYSAMTGISSLRLRVSDPPASLSLALSEAIHHLRAALDNTVYSSVTSDGWVPPEKNTIGFPIYTVRSKYTAAVRDRNLPHASEQLADAVRDVQPFNAVDPERDALADLQALSNVDKHRFLLPRTVVSPDPLLPQNAVFTPLADVSGIRIVIRNNDSLPVNEAWLIGVQGEPASSQFDIRLEHPIEVNASVVFGDRMVSVERSREIATRVRQVCEVLFRP